LTHSIQHEFSGQVTAIYEDGRDEVWLGANRRLYHINRKTAQLWPFKGVDNSQVTPSFRTDQMRFGSATHTPVCSDTT
jgi:hypothetical protein